MTLNEFQKYALETATYSEKYSIIYPALGINGEAGEVAEKVKKVIRDNKGVFDIEKRKEIAKEIGDVLWYCATLSYDLGYSLEEIGQMNRDKLMSRKLRNMIGGSGDNR